MECWVWGTSWLGGLGFRVCQTTVLSQNQSLSTKHLRWKTEGSGLKGEWWEVLRTLSPNKPGRLPPCLLCECVSPKRISPKPLGPSTLSNPSKKRSPHARPPPKGPRKEPDTPRARSALSFAPKIAEAKRRSDGRRRPGLQQCPFPIVLDVAL